MAVLAKNVALDHGEDRLHQNVKRYLPFLNKQGGKVILIAHLHPHGTSGSNGPHSGSALTCTPAHSSASSASSTSAADYITYTVSTSATASATDAATTTTNQLRQ